MAKCCSHPEVDRRAMLALAGVGLPAAVAGLSGAADPTLSLAALQCAARAKVPERLTPPENAALAAFMEVLAVK